MAGKLGVIFSKATKTLLSLGGTVALGVWLISTRKTSSALFSWSLAKALYLSSNPCSITSNPKIQLVVFSAPEKSSRALRIHPLNRELEMAMQKAREQPSQTTTTLKSPMHVTSSTESGPKPFKHLCNLSCAKPRTAGLEVRSRKMENLGKPKIGDSFVHFSRKGSLEFILSSINLQEEALSPLIFVIILRAFRLNVCI
jgi:hypothetical protein